MNSREVVRQMRKVLPSVPKSKLYSKLWNDAMFRGLIKYTKIDGKRNVIFDENSVAEYLSSKLKYRPHSVIRCKRTENTTTNKYENTLHAINLTTIEKRIMANTCRKNNITMPQLVNNIVRKYIEDSIDSATLEL